MERHSSCFIFQRFFLLVFQLYFAIRRYFLSEREVESDNPFFLFPGAEPIAPRSRAVPSSEPRNFLHTRKLNFSWHETVIIPVLYPPFPGV